MIAIKSDDLWLELGQLASSTKTIKAAVAYVSDDSCISFGKGDTLVVDASDASIAGARTSVNVLKSAHEKGANLYSCDTLHGKIIVFDHEAYIGSANISKNSTNSLDEVGIISDHPTIMAGAIQFIDGLAANSTIIDAEFIDRASKIEVRSGGNTSSIGKSRKVKIVKPRSWLLSVNNDAKYPGNEDRVENDNFQIEITDKEYRTWFWMKKGSRFYDQVKTGDSVVIIERERQRANRPESAYRHVVIKSIIPDSDIDVKAYHYAYTEDHIVKWSSFIKMAKKAGISRLGSGLNTVRELSEQQSNLLFELWNA